MVEPYHNLHVRLHDEEGGMHRMIGIVQRRGFDICGMHMPIDDDALKTVRISVRPRHAICKVDVLRRQILRMNNVTEVDIEAVDPAAQDTPKAAKG